MLPQLLTEAQITDVLSFLRTRRCYDRWAPERGSFAVEDAPESCHVAPYYDADVVSCPHLLALANHPLIISAMQNVLGCKPTLSNLGLWWSFKGHATPENAELYHRDVDEWHFIKLFVYLTDVDEFSGPHKFMRQSHHEPKLLPIRRYEDSEVHQAFGADREVTFTGEAGTAFLENTFGFHKGQMPISKNRLLFQAQYSLFPVGIYKYEPTPFQADVHFDSYINRLYIKRQ